MLCKRNKTGSISVQDINLIDFRCCNAWRSIDSLHVPHFIADVAHEEPKSICQGTIST
jgi:hypothetical protein